jgi:hypothetical protein
MKQAKREPPAERQCFLYQKLFRKNYTKEAGMRRNPLPRKRTVKEAQE